MPELIAQNIPAFKSPIYCFVPGTSSTHNLFCARVLQSGWQQEWLALYLPTICTFFFKGVKLCLQWPGTALIWAIK
eukprot:2279165-Ditylum_brightwellii.AAC.1